MLVKNRSFFILIDLAAMAIAYVMTLFALYGTLPSRTKWYGLMAVLGVYLVSDLFFGHEKPLAEESAVETFLDVVRQTVYMAFLFALLLFLLGQRGGGYKTVFRHPGAVFLWMSLPRQNLLQGSDLQLLWK